MGIRVIAVKSRMNEVVRGDGTITLTRNRCPKGEEISVAAKKVENIDFWPLHFPDMFDLR